MDLGLTRRNIGRLVLLTWAVMLAWLARREFSKAESTPVSERTTRLAPGAAYFAVYAGARQIGQLNLSVDTLVEGVRLTEMIVLDLPRGDTTHQLVQSTEYHLSRSLRLRSFTRTVLGIGPQERLEGTVGADSILALRDVEAPGLVAGQTRRRLDPNAVLPAMVPYRVAFGGNLRVGASITLPLAELESGAPRPVTVRVTAESTFVLPDSATWDSAGARWVMATADTVRAWRLEHDAPGAPTVSWVEAGGQLVQEETAGGLRYVRSAFEMVRNNYRRAERGERSDWRRAVPGMVMLTQTGHRVGAAAATRRFLIRSDSAATIRGVPFALPGGRQSLRADTLIVFRDPAADPDRDAARYATGPSWQTPVLDEAITVAATRAVAGARTAMDSARRLTLWVARQIATDGSDRASGTALAALRLGRGSPDAKARLLATLARVVGIPARPVAGLAMTPAGDFGHAWTELWLGRWVAADPSFGQFPASASLVRLTVGTRSRALELLPLGGSARFLPLRESP